VPGKGAEFHGAILGESIAETNLQIDRRSRTAVKKGLALVRLAPRWGESTRLGSLWVLVGLGACQPDAATQVLVLIRAQPGFDDASQVRVRVEAGDGALAYEGTPLGRSPAPPNLWPECR
jgi:hypothetical protein